MARASSPLWLWPGIGALAAFTTALALAGSLPLVRRPPVLLHWPGDVDSARTLLQTLAGSVITVAALTFTLTVVALQLASQQFSPRLLREFTRDPVIKAVLCVLVSTFVFAVTILAHIRSGHGVPDLALFIAAALGMSALVAVLGFVTHIARLLRVDMMMRRVHAETDRTIAACLPPYEDPHPSSPGPTGVGDTASTGTAGESDRSGRAGRAESAAGSTPRELIDVRAPSSGFVTLVDMRALLRAARTMDLLVDVTVRPGDHVVRGTPMAAVTTLGAERADHHAVERVVHRSVRLGYERTVEQDAAFGFRQLTDIAVKALSPGINDPATAAHSIGHMTDLMVKLAGRRLGDTLNEDAAGVGRVIARGRDLTYYLQLSCGPIRRYGRHEPTVLITLLRMLRDVAVAARDQEQRANIADQAALILAELPESLTRHDIAEVENLADRVTQALQGEVMLAYRDRSGETRSI